MESGMKLVDHLLQVCCANLPGDDVCHLLSDVLDLGALGVTSLLGGLVLLSGEADAEHPQHVAVSGLHIHVALHKGLPLLHHGPQLVGGEVHAVEAGQAVLALNILDHQLEFSVGPLEHATLQTVRGNPGAGSSVDQGLSNLTDLKHRGSLDVIPVLSGERVNNLLLDTLLASNLEALVFTDGHNFSCRSESSNISLV